MQYSTNNHLKLMEGTDNVRRQDFVDNFSSIDNGLSKFYVATQSSTNVYKITTGLNKTSLANGYSVKVAIPSASNGAISLIVDSCSAVAIKKPNGNTVTNFKQNGVYHLVYYNSVFILASGGVDDVSFSASDLLTGKSANDSNGEKVNGSMPNRGAVTATLGINGSYTIPQGYHNGNGKVSQSLIDRRNTGVASCGFTRSGSIIYLNTPEGYYNINSSISYDCGNLYAENIIAGRTICGVSGTATIESLGGVRTKSGSQSDTSENTSWSVDCGFDPSLFIIAFGSNSGQYAVNTVCWRDVPQLFSNGNQDGYTYCSDNRFTITKSGNTITVKAAVAAYNIRWYAVEGD